MNGILDTSVLLADQAHDVPERAAISVVTVAELRLGVLLATDPTLRATRLDRLEAVLRIYDPLPVDVDVASAYATVAAAARVRGVRPKSFDCLIAATAVVNRVPVFTYDRDFLKLSGIEVRLMRPAR